MKIYDKNVESYNLMKQALDASSTRNKVIANNIANVNTKGYKRQYVSFEETLNNAVEGDNLTLTNKKHIPINEKKGEINIKRDESSSMRQDGNNVDIENEEVNQAANALMYNSLITDINNRIAMRRSVIKGGR
ncbi:flagellar basal body rod protein FlgB [Haloimpatiens sp. FM7330]|uniref:flagellar basal body rod protein FlgB n=1 Tax=Haloimpatiens sp. FM7330 TaxID=3298610 RepID=UPI003640AAEC